MKKPIEFLDVAGLEAAFGAPEYAYFKEWVQATGSGRGRSHYGTGYNEITKEEYEAHRAQSRKTDIARFMGTQRVGSFHRYEIRLKKPGWPQVLAKELETMDENSRGYSK